MIHLSSLHLVSVCRTCGYMGYIGPMCLTRFVYLFIDGHAFYAHQIDETYVSLCVYTRGQKNASKSNF